VRREAEKPEKEFFWNRHNKVWGSVDLSKVVPGALIEMKTPRMISARRRTVVKVEGDFVYFLPVDGDIICAHLAAVTRVVAEAPSTAQGPIPATASEAFPGISEAWYDDPAATSTPRAYGASCKFDPEQLSATSAMLVPPHVYSESCKFNFSGINETMNVTNVKAAPAPRSLDLKPGDRVLVDFGWSTFRDHVVKQATKDHVSFINDRHRKDWHPISVVREVLPPAPPKAPSRLWRFTKFTAKWTFKGLFLAGLVAAGAAAAQMGVVAKILAWAVR
jgi:hypothetical protein